MTTREAVYRAWAEADAAWVRVEVEKKRAQKAQDRALAIQREFVAAVEAAVDEKEQRPPK